MSDQPVLAPSELLIAQIEALLFVASGPVTATQLAIVLDVTPRLVEKGLERLRTRYTLEQQPSGLRLQEHQGRFQLTTAPDFSDLIERFLGLDASSHLSRAALETLAIIAYQQPVTRPEIDAIRGVNSDGVLKSLLSKGLVQEVGRAERPGRPFLYSSTADFLQHFGLTSLDELPPLTIEEPPTPDPDYSDDI